MAILALALSTACGGDRIELEGPVMIESPAGAGAGEPNLFPGAGGAAYMSWLEPVDSAGASASTRRGNFALRFAVLDSAGAWTHARTITQAPDLFVNWADFPSIARAADGTLIAHWLQRTGGNTYAYAVRTSVSNDDGVTWSAPATPHADDTPTEHGFVSLVPGDNGNTEIFWLDGRNYAPGPDGEAANEMTLRHAVISSNGSVGPETEIDARVCDCCQTAAARTASGTVVVYRDRSADEIRDIYVIRRDGGEWSDPARVYADDWKINACPVNGPSISARGDQLAVAWFTAARDSPAVKLVFSRDGGRSFGNPTRVDGGNPEGRVDVELLADGSALVTWIERAADGAEIRMRRVDGAGEAGEPVTVASASAERAGGFPRIAITGNYALLAWTVPGDPSQVRVARARLN